MSELIDWLFELNEPHLHICSLAAKMKYIKLIQPLSWKQVLGSASYLILLSMIISEIKSSTLPFETSTLKFNFYAGSSLFTPINPFSALFCSALCSRKLNTRKFITHVLLPCIFQLMGGPGRTTEDRRERSGYLFPSLTLLKYHCPVPVILYSGPQFLSDSSS